MNKILHTAIALAFTLTVKAQCPFDPTVTPANLILCPNTMDTLWTQVYDSVQWYKDGNILTGATNQYYVVDYFADAGSNFSVLATDSGCTEMSPQVLLDGWVFLPPVVSTTGNFTTGPNGETVICAGDTVIFTLLMPYDTNITWFKDGNILPDTGNDLYATTAGLYHVSGAPSICPDFIQQLGVTLEVIVDICAGIPENEKESILVFPNPVSNRLTLLNSDEAGISRFRIVNSLGRIISENAFTGFIDTEEISPGAYMLFLECNSGNIILKFLKE